MREVKANTQKRKKAYACVDEPRNGYASTQEALSDIGRFITGQEDKPDADLQLEDITQSIRHVMDDELLSSLEQVVEDALFSPQAAEHDEVMERYLPTYMMMKRMRELQKTRLRDALQRLVSTGKS